MHWSVSGRESEKNEPCHDVILGFGGVRFFT